MKIVWTAAIRSSQIRISHLPVRTAGIFLVAWAISMRPQPYSSSFSFIALTILPYTLEYCRYSHHVVQLHHILALSLLFPRFTFPPTYSLYHHRFYLLHLLLSCNLHRRQQQFQPHRSCRHPSRTSILYNLTASLSLTYHRSLHIFPVLPIQRSNTFSVSSSPTSCHYTIKLRSGAFWPPIHPSSSLIGSGKL